MANNSNDTARPTRRARRIAPDTRLRSLRLERELLQITLALKSGVSVSWISVLEREPGLMTEPVAQRLAGALGVDVKELWP